MNVVLISTYEMGRQPFGLASPTAWLREAGASVACQDLSVEELDEKSVAAADMVAFYVPMHTATRLAARVAERVRQLAPRAHLCFYGLYASINEGYLRKLGAETILGGEFETGLVSLGCTSDPKTCARRAIRRPVGAASTGAATVRSSRCTTAPFASSSRTSS